MNKIKEYILKHPGVYVSFGYFYFSILGLLHELSYFDYFDIQIIDFLELNDLLLLPLRNPEMANLYFQMFFWITVMIFLGTNFKTVWIKNIFQKFGLTFMLIVIYAFFILTIGYYDKTPFILPKKIPDTQYAKINSKEFKSNKIIYLGTFNNFSIFYDSIVTKPILIPNGEISSIRIIKK